MKLMEDFMNERNNIRKRKGLAPVGETGQLQEKEENQPASIVYNGIPTPTMRTIPQVLTVEPLQTPPLRDDEYTTKDQRDWQLTMIALTPLQGIYEWAEATRPGSLQKFSDFETQCLMAAKDGHSAEYKRLRAAYLEGIGKVCELHWQAHHKEPYKDIRSLRFSLNTIRMYPHPGTIPNPEEQAPPAFYAREIPAILTLPEKELQLIYHTKEVMPGSLIEYLPK